MGIRQLASELRLSIGTVSRALNDRPDVNPETRARVKEAALRVGYVPNQSGRSLRSGRTGIVAAIVPSIGASPNADAGLFAVLEGARRTLQRRSLDLIVLFRGPEEDPLTNLQRIVQRRIADSIIISQTTPNDPRLDWMRLEGVEFMAFGRTAFCDYPFVDFDFEAAAAEAVQRFVADGHQRLALTAGEPMNNYEYLLLEAARAEAKRQGLGPKAVSVLRTREGQLTKSARALIEDPVTAPTAILASHECLAVALYDTFRSVGRSVGGEVSLVCIFPPVGARGLDPALSYFDADLDAVGVAIAEHLIALAPGTPTEARPASALVPLTFTPRASHGPARLPLAVRG